MRKLMIVSLLFIVFSSVSLFANIINIIDTRYSIEGQCTYYLHEPEGLFYCTEGYSQSEAYQVDATIRYASSYSGYNTINNYAYSFGKGYEEFNFYSNASSTSSLTFNPNENGTLTFDLSGMMSWDFQDYDYRPNQFLYFSLEDKTTHETLINETYLPVGETIEGSDWVSFFPKTQFITDNFAISMYSSHQYEMNIIGSAVGYGGYCLRQYQNLNVSIGSVPEPSCLMLSGIGLLSLLPLGWKLGRKKLM